MALSCPFCRSQSLDPFQIAKDTLGKCPSCHGLWFNRQELRDVEELPESELMADFQDQLDDSSLANSKQVVQNRPCPACAKPMDGYQYDGFSGIWINHCPEGHGVWLDKGEVLKIHRHLHAAMKALPPEKMMEIAARLKRDEVDEKRKEEEAAMSIFADHKGSPALPLWHLMDGVNRVLYHSALKLGA